MADNPANDHDQLMPESPEPVDDLKRFDLLDDLLDVWEIHDDINRYLLEWMPDEGLEAVTLLKTGKPSRGRNVGRNFAHMHAVRCSKLKQNRVEVGDLPSVAGAETPDRDALIEALAGSGERVAALVRRAITEGKPLRSWKRSPTAWLGYLISHESHHRGQIAQALKQSGIRPPQEVSYGIWGYWSGYELKQPPVRPAGD